MTLTLNRQTYMIIGSGLLARAFSQFRDRGDVCIYASGVSNSSCVDEYEFNREREMIQDTLSSLPDDTVFIYFSTCSIYDPTMQKKAYVKHKLEMEKIVSSIINYVIFRLPQVAGKTPNPHTLLNYLYARIVRGERIYVWENARRNIIDVDDVVSLSNVFIDDPRSRGIILNIANPYTYTMMEIVNAFENVLKKKAVYLKEDKGGAYPIEVQRLLPFLNRAMTKFDDKYLENIIYKYYGNK